MKKLLITLFICSLAIISTGCEALEEALSSQSGCMLEDAPNHDESALLPCTTECLGEQTGSNCCCEEIIYGCMDTSAPNYTDTANSPCAEDVAGVETPNACCTASIAGCMDEGASNYNVLATVATNADSCTYASATLEDGTVVTYGCMNSAACNTVAGATADCNVENATIAGIDWVQNDDCCDMSGNFVCYLDLNNNGYYEEVDSTTYASESTCNCGERGVGWVSGDNVAEAMEVQGCTQSKNAAGDICPEYDPSANVDNGGCCLEEIDWSQFDGFDENSAQFMGVFDVSFTYGMLDNAGECIADTDMGTEGGGPAMAQITLGPPDPNGIGQMQYFEEYKDEFDSRSEWEFHVPEANTEDECINAAEENDSWDYNCGDWSINCEGFSDQGDCPIDNCFWETNFCHNAFHGSPCHEIVVIDGHIDPAKMECLDNGCEWTIDNTCVQPAHIPGEQCWGMDEYDCGYDPECMTSIEFEDYDPEEEGDGPPDCMLDDDPACNFPEGLDDYNGVQMCDWLTTDIWPSSGPSDCILDCEQEIVYDEDGYEDGHMGQRLQQRVNQCEICLSENTNNLNDNGAMCDNLWFEDDGGGDDGPGPDGPNCSAWQGDGAACPSITSKDACFCDDDCMWQGDENGSCIDDMCAGYDGDNDTCLSADGCDLVYPGNHEFNCTDNNGCCVTMLDDGPGCLGDCVGIENIQNATATQFCEWITPIWGTSGDDSCVQDCDGEEYFDFSFLDSTCDWCLSDPDVDCEDYFDFGDGFNFDPDIAISNIIFSQINKIHGMSQLNNSLSRSDDCSFDDGYLDDCSGDGDCCPREWVGDGYCDGPDQEYGCDLTCYEDSEGNGVAENLDGGDCGEGFLDLECVPNNPCYYLDDSNDCAWQGCDWNDEWSECHPKPVMTDVHGQCGGFDEAGCTSGNTDGLCQWESAQPDNFQGNWMPHCAPTPAAQGDDCFSLNNRFDCDNSDNCNWDAPDWMEDWQTGACFSHNPCVTPENNNPDSCDNNSACEWDWGQNFCVEAGFGNNFCDCRISHTERSCNDMYGSGAWQMPDWAEGCDDCDWVENECMVPMHEQDCFHEYVDPCSQFNEGGNEHTDWDEANHTCTKSFSFSDAGTWGLGDGCLELSWDETQEPECTDDPLQMEETCYCFDCMWDYDSGSCADWSDDGMGRTTEQAKMHDFQEMIYELSGSSGDGDCIEYQLNNDGEIQLIETWDEGCQIITLTPVPASGS